ncbi:sulfatase family protein [Rhodohalobacter sp. 8-1]|uniref:sulfatase family protein n=1 Tax=Rhodohalobacter sp. 8-1 TaxID=3131972 RepID=UPI0030EC3EFF
MSNSFAVLLLLLIYMFGLSGCAEHVSDEKFGNGNEVERPNIIIIYADDVGYGDIGAYGSELIPTPHIDQLAADGIRFTSAYATAATCTPSRYSLLTGEYAFRNERAQILPGNAPLLIEPGSFTLPEMLRRAGYRTSVVGKWHLGLGEGDLDWNIEIKPGPLEVGFDESFLLPATNDRVPTVYVDGHYVTGLSEEDDPLRVSYSEQIGDLPTGHSHPELVHYPADDQHSGTIVKGISRIGWQDGGQSAWWDDQEMAPLFIERSQEFIEREKEGPFFLYLSLHENHVPRWPNPQFVGQSQTGLRGDTVVELDWVVGQIMETLKDLSIREETLVIFTSDNGPIFDDGYEDGAIKHANGHQASGPFRGGKYTAFEGGTRMPFIASWPAGIDRGLVTDGMFSQVDLMATLAALSGAELPEEAGRDSQNLLPVLLGKSSEGRDFLVQQGAGSQLYGFRHGDWKLIPASSNRPAFIEDKHNSRDNPLTTTQVSTEAYLFNLKNDSGETNNLAEKHPEKVRQMTDFFEKILETPEKLLTNR